MIIILRLLAHSPGCAICMSWAVESCKQIGLLKAVVLYQNILVLSRWQENLQQGCFRWSTVTSDPGRPEDSTSADISTLTKVKNYRIGLMPVRVGNYSPTSLHLQISTQAQCQQDWRTSTLLIWQITCNIESPNEQTSLVPVRLLVRLGKYISNITVKLHLYLQISTQA